MSQAHEFVINGDAHAALNADPDPDGSHLQIRLLNPPVDYRVGDDVGVRTLDGQRLPGVIVALASAQMVHVRLREGK